MLLLDRCTVDLVVVKVKILVIVSGSRSDHGDESSIHTEHDLLKYEQGCPTKDRPLSTKDGRSSAWHADQMI